jgi:DNA-binding HxlR family transcriptional regulator
MEATDDTAVKSQKSAYPGITPDIAAEGITSALRAISGRWKMTILFHLFGRRQRRFSELERLIPNVTQKMLTQHLRELERDGVLQRTVFPEAPPRVEYSLTEIGESLCPALDELLLWEQTRSRNRDAELGVTSERIVQLRTASEQRCLASTPTAARSRFVDENTAAPSAPQGPAGSGRRARAAF